MHLGLNGQQLLIKNPAGPEKYTYNLFKALAQIDHENDYTIYFSQEPTKEFFEDLTAFNPRFSSKTIRKDLAWTQVWLSKELLNNPVDLYFSSVHTIPIRRNKKMAIVGMIHGLEYTYSKEFKNPIRKLTLHLPEKYVCQNADNIITPSLATKYAIIEKNWVEDSEKIKVVYEGVDNKYFSTGQGSVTKVKVKYNLEFPYFIFVSTIQPRKNLPKTIEGFSEAIKREEKLQNTKFVIVGKKGWDYEESFEAPKKYGIEDKVVFLGRVPDEDLPGLYKGAEAFVSLSLEEGFGLPLVEAMATGIHCLVSSIPVYKEVGKKIPTFVETNDIDNIANGFITIANRRKTENYTENAQKLARKYSWNETAVKTLEIFKDTFQKHRV